MLAAYTLGADPPPGALTFAEILDGVARACATNADRFSAAALNHFASWVQYYQRRKAAVSDPLAPGYNAQLVAALQALSAQANTLAQRAGARQASCAEIAAGMRAMLDQHKRDPRDDLYLEMNREIRAFHDINLATAAGGGSPAPRRSLKQSLAMVGLLGLTLGLGTAAAVVIVRNR